MHKGRITVAALAGIGIISTFLPWITNTPDFSQYGLDIKSISRTDSGMDNSVTATVSLLFFGGIIAFALLGKKDKMIAKGFPKLGILVLSGLLLLGTLVLLLGCAVSPELEAEFGLYLIAIITICTALFPYLFKADGSVEIPTVKAVAKDIETSADIVEDKVEDISDKIEDKFDGKDEEEKSNEEE